MRKEKFELIDTKGHSNLVRSAKEALTLFLHLFIRDSYNTGGYLTVGIDSGIESVTTLLHGIGEVINPSVRALESSKFTVIDEFYSYAKKKGKSSKRKPIIVSKKNYGWIAFPRSEDNNAYVDVLAFRAGLGHGSDCVAAWTAIDNGYMTHEEAINLYKENQFIDRFLQEMIEYRKRAIIV